MGQVKKMHTCLKAPCLPKNEIVVPPIGAILFGPTQSYTVNANCAFLGKSQKCTGNVIHSLKLEMKVIYNK